MLALLIIMHTGCATEADRMVEAERRRLFAEFLGQLSPEERTQLCDRLVRQQRDDCTTLPRSALVYQFRPPVIGVDARPVIIPESDWEACDGLAHRQALVPLQDSYMWMPDGSSGFLMIMPNPNSSTTLDQRYEMAMRSCLVRRGYRTVPSYQPPGPSFADPKKE